MADKVAGGVFAVEKWIRNSKDQAVKHLPELCIYVHARICLSVCLGVSVCVSYLAGGQQVYVGMQPADTSRESNSGSVPGTSSA